MKILFVHQNFPGQFRALATMLAKDKNNSVVTFSMNGYENPLFLKNVNYKPQRSSSEKIHPWAGDFESKVIRGEAAYLAAKALKKEGFIPDIIIGHYGWGETLFLKEVWPHSKFLAYCEFYYSNVGQDFNFDPEFPAKFDGDECKLLSKNINNLVNIENADYGISPTNWQKSTYPLAYQNKIRVIHDGIDTNLCVPNPGVKIKLLNGRILGRENKVITFVNRNLEPYRGYHSFMRALPAIQEKHPDADILIIGQDAQGYGVAPQDGRTWKKIYFDEVKDRLILDKVHYLGHVPYDQLIAIFQVSSVHVYLTYPFVLSWSLLDAMSCGCAIVGSDTAPVKEIIENNYNGRLVDMFNIEEIADQISNLLLDRDAANLLAVNARKTAVDSYDLHRVCLPNQINYVNQIFAND